jgi:hypothetical protein
MPAYQEPVRTADTIELREACRRLAAEAAALIARSHQLIRRTNRLIDRTNQRLRRENDDGSAGSGA